MKTFMEVLLVGVPFTILGLFMAAALAMSLTSFLIAMYEDLFK